MINLSVNINKAATLRNSRDINVPDLTDIVEICIAAGCQGITVHPRSDERHIHFADVKAVASAINHRVEFNVECDPDDRFIDLVVDTRPTQCTLVPTIPGEITSSDGFDLSQRSGELTSKLHRLRTHGIRTSLFSRTDIQQVRLAAELQVDAVEFYTGRYAMASDEKQRRAEYEKLFRAATVAHELGLRVHCGHDLTVENLPMITKLPGLAEVSIGHHLIARALSFGLPTSIADHLRVLS